MAFEMAVFKDNYLNLSKNCYAEVMPSGNTEKTGRTFRLQRVNYM